ncbi:MAG: LLM class flavin-dependent oxidoreductase [Promethearchaeota archaeon]|nr:MAG: LLM class flavin-dependent oxidoreductase [Candidatus Lokiarchaeota archaeon]
MKFGYTLENFDVNLNPENLIDTVKLLELSGFESVWTVDHIMQPKGGHIPQYDKISEVIVTLSFLGGKTNKIKLGVSALVLPIRNPILLAKQLATLDYLTNGRMLIVFVGGWNEGEFKFLGKDFKNRGKIFDEYIQIVKTLWMGKSDFDGSFYQFKNASFKPIRDDLKNKPILIGGYVKSAIERAIHYGDGWHPGAMTGKEMEETIEPFRNQIGKKSFQLSVHSFISKNTDIEKFVNEYAEHGISRIIFDTTRTDIPPIERKDFLIKLCDFVKNY